MNAIRRLAPLLACAFLAACAINPSENQKEASRKDLAEMTESTLARLYQNFPGSKRHVEGAYGYAVFSNYGLQVFMLGGGVQLPRGTAPPSAESRAEDVRRFLAKLPLPELDVELPLLEYPHDIIRHHLNVLTESLEHRLAVGDYRELAPGVFAANGAHLGQHRGVVGIGEGCVDDGARQRPAAQGGPGEVAIVQFQHFAIAAPRIGTARQQHEVAVGAVGRGQVAHEAFGPAAPAVPELAALPPCSSPSPAASPRASSRASPRRWILKCGMTAARAARAGPPLRRARL